MGSLLCPELSWEQEGHIIYFHTIRRWFRGDVAVFLLDGTTVGLSELRDPSTHKILGEFLCAPRRVPRKIHAFRKTSRLEQRRWSLGIAHRRCPGRDNISGPRLIIGVTRHGRPALPGMPMSGGGRGRVGSGFWFSTQSGSRAKITES